MEARRNNPLDRLHEYSLKELYKLKIKYYLEIVLTIIFLLAGLVFSIVEVIIHKKYSGIIGILLIPPLIFFHLTETKSKLQQINHYIDGHANR